MVNKGTTLVKRRRLEIRYMEDELIEAWGKYGGKARIKELQKVRVGRPYDEATEEYLYDLDLRCIDKEWTLPQSEAAFADQVMGTLKEANRFFSGNYGRFYMEQVMFQAVILAKEKGIVVRVDELDIDRDEISGMAPFVFKRRDDKGAEFDYLAVLETHSRTFCGDWQKMVGAMYGMQVMQDKLIPVYGILSSGFSWQFFSLDDSLRWRQSKVYPFGDSILKMVFALTTVDPGKVWNP